MIMEDGTIRHCRKDLNYPGHAHGLTFTCYHGYKLLSKDRTRQWLVDALDRARSIHELLLLAYVIMPEHAHVVLLPEREAYNMGEIRQSIKQPVARRATRFLRRCNPQWIEKLTARQPGGKVRCHFWQDGGGYDRNIVSPDALWSTIQYIHANPVRRGLVCHPSEWEWSSARWWDGQGDVRLTMDVDRSISL